MDWRELMQNHILERGYRYYQEGFVVDFHADEDGVQATVQGSKAYSVRIDIEDGKILDMDCDCPYADEGNYCKHMAAVLYCMEEGDLENLLEEEAEAELEMYSGVVSGKKERIKELVERADERVIRDFLTEILEQDERLVNGFKRALGCKVTPLDMKKYKTQINEIFRRYADRHGFIDYNHADSFTLELECFLDAEIGGLVDKEEFEEAFELTNYIFIKVGNQDMDDSAGGTGMLANTCIEIWRTILKDCHMDQKRKMFYWYIEHLNEPVIDYMEDYIEQMIFEDFQEEEFLIHKLDFTDQKAAGYKQEKDSWKRGYYGGKWAIKHIQTMLDLKMPAEQIHEYCKENLRFDRVREYYVSQLIERRQYHRAIQVLEEGKSVGKDFPGTVAEYSLALKDLYQKTGNSQAYEQELWALLLTYKAGNLDIFKELKALYTEAEWKAKREVIFEHLSPYSGLDRLYEAEELYDRLLEIVIKSDGLYKLTQYEKNLKKTYSAELFAKYEKEVRGMALSTSDRRRYQDIAAVLRRMKKYPEGAQKVQEIVADFRLAYRNRRAMMEELGRV